MSVSLFGYPRNEEEKKLFQQLEATCTLLRSYYPAEWKMFSTYHSLFIDVTQRIYESTLKSTDVLFYQSAYYALNICFLTNYSDMGALRILEKLLAEKQCSMSFIDLLRRTLEYCQSSVEMHKVEDQQQEIIFVEEQLLDGTRLQNLLLTGQYRFRLETSVQADVTIEPHVDDAGHITPIVQLRFPSSPFIGEERFLSYHLSSLQDVVAGFFLSESTSVTLERIPLPLGAEEEIQESLYPPIQLDEHITKVSLQTLLGEIAGITMSVISLPLNKVEASEPLHDLLERELGFLFNACGQRGLIPMFTTEEEESKRMTPEQLAQLFHETYERLAPQYGYETRSETAIPWQQIPSNNSNKRLMIAVAGEVLKKMVDIQPLVVHNSDSDNFS